MDSPPEFKQDGLHGILAPPLGKAGELCRINLYEYKNHNTPACPAWHYLSSSHINAGQIHPRDELQAWRVVGVVGTTVDVNTVNSVFMDTLYSSVRMTGAQA